MVESLEQADVIEVLRRLNRPAGATGRFRTGEPRRRGHVDQVLNHTAPDSYQGGGFTVLLSPMVS